MMIIIISECIMCFPAIWLRSWNIICVSWYTSFDEAAYVYNSFDYFLVIQLPTM